MSNKDYRKCKYYREKYQDIEMLYGYCPIYGYCMVAANLIRECEYLDDG